MSVLGPRRIVCLTEETTETLYLLGEQWRVAGISGYTVRPPQARREKPRVSAFTSANLERIAALRPDLVIGFSDMQADIARDLIRDGFEVLVFNQRTIEGIFRMIRTLAALVRASEKGERLVLELLAGLDGIRASSARLERRPRVYFEEWDEPMISGIGWVSELVSIAGGDDVFAELASGTAARERIIRDPAEVVRRGPEIVIGSWCGKKFRPERVRARPGWAAIPAVRDGELHEIKSAEILQPGPAALTDGVRRLHAIVSRWAARAEAAAGG